MDIVYILKEDEDNLDLRYSLRSLSNVSGYDRIYISGYKPSWVVNVSHIPTSQSKNKWENAIGNIITACKNPTLSQDIILFNDDFFAIKPVNLETDINLCRNSLDDAIEMYRRKVRTRWIRAHAQVKELLESIHAEHFMNFELHIPIVINRQRFLRMMRNIKVTQFLKKNGIVLYRSLYGNLDWRDPTSMNGHDCKPGKNKDIQDHMKDFQWLSVFDGVTSKLDKYPGIRKALSPFLEKKSIFEK